MHVGLWPGLQALGVNKLCALFLNCTKKDEQVDTSSGKSIPELTYYNFTQLIKEEKHSIKLRPSQVWTKSVSSGD